MEIIIRTLTPLWTGGVYGMVDRIHETGILGSLRWWMEALVRGMGGKACDPSQDKCRFDAEKYEKIKTADERQRLRDAGLCNVCQVFGATGWRRRFRLEVVDHTQQDTSSPKKITARRPINRQTNRAPTWWFADYPRSGNLSVQIQRLDSDFSPEVIAGLIQFIADWGAIGARAQMGFGVIELQNDRIDTQPLFDWLVPVAGNHTYPDLPSLRNIFLARISPKNGENFSEEDTFNLKYDIRQLFSGQQNRDLRHFIMGTIKSKRIATKVKMSRPYNSGKEIRVWGWIPEKADVYQGSWNRGKVVSEIHKHLSTNYILQVWREMNSPRDTLTPNNGDVQIFLGSLLSVKEGEDAA